MPFSLRLERFVGGLGVVSLGVGTMFGGVLLCVLASMVGIGHFTVQVMAGAEEIHKEVGFWSALDWSMTFLILLPLFLVFFVLQIDQCALICRNFSELGIVTAPDGAPVEEQKLSTERRAQLQAASTAFWLLLVAAVIYSTSDWWMSCGKALLLGNLGLLILLPLISMTFLAIGLLLVVAVIYALVQLLLTRIKQLSGSGAPAGKS